MPAFFVNFTFVGSRLVWSHIVQTHVRPFVVEELHSLFHSLPDLLDGMKFYILEYPCADNKPASFCQTVGREGPWSVP